MPKDHCSKLEGDIVRYDLTLPGTQYISHLAQPSVMQCCHHKDMHAPSHIRFRDRCLSSLSRI